MNLPPPQDDDPIITQFTPEYGQWELNDENIKPIDPQIGETILHNYCCYTNTTPLEVYRYLIETKGCDVNVQNKYNDTSIHLALFYFDPNDGGNITVLMYLLTQTNINVNIKGGNGGTILHYACENINKLPLDVFQLLIETMGCDVNGQDNNKDTPLHLALCNFNPNDGDITILTYLIHKNYVDVHIRSQNGYTLLLWACEKINKLPLDVFKVLIETHDADVDVQNHYQDTPLHNALCYFDPNDGGDINVLTYLLTQMNTKSKYGYTLLHYACKNIKRLSLNVFKLLIETKGCDVNAQNNIKDTPLHYAFHYFDPNKHRDVAILTYLLSQKGVDGNIKDQFGKTLLHLACCYINALPLNVFKLLIETKGCDINVQDNYQDTPLHNALCYFDPNDGGDINVLMYLLSQRGINGNIKDQFGKTLLHLACCYINALSLNVFKVLIETHDADVDVQDNYQDTPLHYALCYFDPNKNGIITVLQYLSYQTNTKGQCGGTILHLACQNINKLPLDVFQLLIETMGCDVNIQDNNKDTPLHYAFRCFNPNDGGDSPVLHYLLSQKGVDGNIKGWDGYILLHRACININHIPLEIFKVLIETKGCDVNAQDNSNNTPIHCALDQFKPSDGGDVNVLAYLINQKAVNINIKGRCDRTLLHTTCMINPPNPWYSAEPNANFDTTLCRIVEDIIERCLQQVLDETTP
jgi:ankyrin repeat protein